MLENAQFLLKIQQKLLPYNLTIEACSHSPTIEASVEDELGLSMERSIGRTWGEFVPYVTRSKHGQLGDHTPCWVRRTAKGYFVVYVSLSRTDYYTRLAFKGAWYLKGYENKERINKVYKKRGLKRPTGCRPF